jgi:hypothetical protein
MLQRLGHNVSSIIVKNFGVADGSVCQSVDHASLPFTVPNRRARNSASPSAAIAAPDSLSALPHSKPSPPFRDRPFTQRDQPGPPTARPCTK